jgi:ferredoxin
VSAVEAIRTDAQALLSDGRVRLVLAFRERAGRRIPYALVDPAAAEAIVFDDGCRQNLAAYVTKPEVRAAFPVAVLARPAVLRSLVVLHAESQITSADVLVLAIGPERYHGPMDLAAAAALLQSEYGDLAPDPALLARMRELAGLDAAGRSAFWREQLSRCTRCYACRAACPGCYCASCIVERNQPQWIAGAPIDHGNYGWSVIRAYHQAGRCTLCGACEEACPQGLPLMLLNLAVTQCVEEAFGHRSGYDLEGRPLIGSWDAGDGDTFIR